MSDPFLPAFLTRGPFFGKQIAFLHYGRPSRPVRFGQRNRGFTATIFQGTDGGSGGSGSGLGYAFGDAVLIEGPGPMYGTSDNQTHSSLDGSGGVEDIDPIET